MRVCVCQLLNRLQQDSARGAATGLELDMISYRAFSSAVATVHSLVLRDGSPKPATPAS